MRCSLFNSLVVATMLAAGCSSEKPAPIEDGPDLEPTYSSTETDDDIAGDIGNDTSTAGEVDTSDWQPYFYELIEYETINPAGDRDFYAIEGALGQNYMFYTSSYFLLGQNVILDTVIRIYDTAGTLVATNDDMPYRYQETDSGLFYQPTENGTFYVEVVEFGDWYGSGANGGDGFEYELYGVLLEAYENNPNSTVAEAQSYQDDIEATGYGYIFGPPYSEYGMEFYGEITDVDDVDVWPFVTGDDDDGNVLQFSLWPEGYGTLTPTMRLYNEDGDLVAETAKPQITPEYPFVYDAGISYRVFPNTLYFVEVNAGDSSTGMPGFYPGTIVNYLPELADQESSGNDSMGSASSISMEESSATPGYHFGRMTGMLDTDDPVDVVEILSDSVGGTANKYLGFSLHADEAGSFLDATVRVTDGEGNELFVVEGNTETGGIDPDIAGELISSDTDLYLHIEPVAQGDGDQSNSWFLLAWLDPDAPA
jgi:hypothetical protein